MDELKLKQTKKLLLKKLGFFKKSVSLDGNQIVGFEIGVTDKWGVWADVVYSSELLAMSDSFVTTFPSSTQLKIVLSFIIYTFLPLWKTGKIKKIDLSDIVDEEFRIALATCFKAVIDLNVSFYANAHLNYGFTLGDRAELILPSYDNNKRKPRK